MPNRPAEVLSSQQGGACEYTADAYSAAQRVRRRRRPLAASAGRQREARLLVGMHVFAHPPCRATLREEAPANRQKQQVQKGESNGECDHPAHKSGGGQVRAETSRVRACN
jgi:hypothetical protein